MMLRVSGQTAVIMLTLGTLALGQEQPGTGQPASEHQHVSEPSMAELFAAREASGTAWLPDESPMYGFDRRVGPWIVMLDGTAVGQFLYEPGQIHRTGGFSSQQVSSVNWLMGMVRRPAGKGRVGLRAMVSFEPWTVGDCGFINMLASGEMCEGDTIHDRQHPHDVFMEIAADYDRPIRSSLRWQLYAGFAGEPALGPPAFPHRVSAMPNPIAPITHHWLDSSHITFGLITTGVSERRWKAEMSVFNGREPDEARADVDLGPLDSVSARVTLLPTPRLALQVSAAHLHAAEAEFPPQPRSDVDRVTASATYHRMTGAAIWATTLAYGMNAGPEVIPGDVVNLTTHAGLLESTLSLGDRHTWFGRAELVGKAWTRSAHARDSSDNLHRREGSGWIRPILLDWERRSGCWRDGVRQHGSAGARTAVPETREPGRWRLCFDPARAAWESVARRLPHQRGRLIAQLHRAVCGDRS